MPTTDVLRSYLVCQLTALLNISNGISPPGVLEVPVPDRLSSAQLVKLIDIYTRFLRSNSSLPRM